MKKKSLLLFFVFNVIFIGNGLHCHVFAQNVWSGGVETKWYDDSKNSFEITTAEELAGLAFLVNNGNSFDEKTITLKNDLILNSIQNEEGWLSKPNGKHWIPIGTSEKPFKGTFDGKKHTISGMYIKTEKKYSGLFGAVENAVIKNVGLVKFYLNGDKYNGGVAGYSNKSGFENIYSKGKVALKGGGNIGGLIGHAVESDFESVSSHISIISDKKVESVGGLIGNCEDSNIKNAYSIGIISANESDMVGGIIGYQKKTNISNAYTVCEISIKGGKDNIGGFVGYLQEENNILSCYFNKDKYNGKGIGSNKGNGSISISEKESRELRKSATFIGWSFTDIWAISENKNDGYPYLLIEESGNPPIVYPDILHVKENGNDTKDGSDWDNAITLSKALEVLNKRSYDAKRLQINIAKGDYQTQGKAFLIQNNVLIYGGHAVSDNTADATTFYGGDKNRVLVIYNKENLLDVTIEGVKIKKGTAHDEVAGPALNSGETTKYRGGGIFNANANTTLNEVVIAENTASNEATDCSALGGGIYNLSGKLTLRNCLVSSNVATKQDNEGKGGGIYLDEGTAETSIHSGTTISQNIAVKGMGLGVGGGIYISKGNTEVLISDASITKNTAIDNANNESVAQGGGIYNEKRNLRIETTQITHNIATVGKGNGSGGGIYHPFLFDPENQTTITLNNSEISENIAFKNTHFVVASDLLKGSGGGIYFGEGSIVLHECKLQKNTAAYANVNETVSGNGGAIYNVAGRMIMEACEILENTATNAKGNGYGGGISNASGNEVKLFNTLIANNAAGNQALGGGIYNTTGKDVTLTNVTIAGNTAGQKGVAKINGDSDVVGGGSGIYNYNAGDITIENTIIWNNQEESGIVQYLDDGATHFGGYCFISDHENSAGHGDTVILDGKNRHVDYPKFVDATSHNYRLKAASPLRNLARKDYIENGNTWNEPDKDLDNNGRIKRSLDLGVYESNPFNVTLSDSANFSYNVPDSLDKYGVISPTAYEVDPDSSFVFALQIDPNIFYTAVVKVGGTEYFPDEAKMYTIPNIAGDTHIDVNLTTDKYVVTMPAVTGLSTDPVAGDHTVQYDGIFDFIVTKKQGYENHNLLISADQKYNVETVDAASGKYRIKNIRHDVKLTMTLSQTPVYTVMLKSIDEIQTSPKPGSYSREERGSFEVTFVIPEKYEADDIVVDLNGNLKTFNRVTGNTYSYTITNIKGNHIISIGKNKQYQINLNKTEGVIFSPSSGAHSVGKYDDFSFTITLDKSYNQSTFKVYANKLEIFPTKKLDGVYTYILSSIQKDYNITVEGVKKNDDVSNEDIDGKLKVYSDNKTLFIQTSDIAKLTIYSINGQVHKQNEIPIGTTSIQLPSGVYIVKINDEIFKIII